jgi:hypothetical protein
LDDDGYFAVQEPDLPSEVHPTRHPRPLLVLSPTIYMRTLNPPHDYSPCTHTINAHSHTHEATRKVTVPTSSLKRLSAQYCSARLVKAETRLGVRLGGPARLDHEPSVKFSHVCYTGCRYVLGVCGYACYCGPDHQKADWKDHKLQCKLINQALALPAGEVDMKVVDSESNGITYLGFAAQWRAGRSCSAPARPWCLQGTRGRQGSNSAGTCMCEGDARGGQATC